MDKYTIRKPLRILAEVHFSLSVYDPSQSVSDNPGAQMDFARPHFVAVFLLCLSDDVVGYIAHRTSIEKSRGTREANGVGNWDAWQLSQFPHQRQRHFVLGINSPNFLIGGLILLKSLLMRLARRLGADTDAILGEIVGLDDDAIRRLRDGRVV